MVGKQYWLGSERKSEFHDRLRREGRFYHYGQRKRVMVKQMGMTPEQADMELYPDYPPLSPEMVATHIRNRDEMEMGNISATTAKLKAKLDAERQARQDEQKKKDDEKRLEEEAREREFINVTDVPYDIDSVDPSEAIQWAASKMKIKGLKPEDAPNSTAWFILQHAQSSRINEEKFWHNLYPKIFARIERELVDAREREREAEERAKKDAEMRQGGDVTELIERLSSGN